MAERDEVVVLGAGVIGLACAYELLRAGVGVRVLDQIGPGAGASHGNCGTITPSHAPPLAEPRLIPTAIGWMLRADAPLYIKPRLDPALWRWLLSFAWRCRARPWTQSAMARAALLNLSRQRLPELLAELGDGCEFRESGLLYVYRDRRKFESMRTLPATLEPLRIKVEVLTGAEVEALEPALLPGVVAGMRFPDDAVLRPDRLVKALAEAVVRLGGVIESGVEVTGIERRNRQLRTLIAGERRIPCQRVLLALGAWSPNLARALGLRIPIQPGKGYSITMSPPALVPRQPLVLKERSVCVTAWTSGFRLGSTMEFAGYDDSLNSGRLAALERAAREYLREPVGPVVQERWYGWRPMTWDDLPLLGPAPGYDNLHLATGHGMLGVSMAAATALLLRDQILGAGGRLDGRPYDPGRFR